MSKRVTVAVTVMLSVAAYVGCGAPPEAPVDEPKVGATSEAFVACGNYPYTCTTDYANAPTRPWLLAADCSCPFVPTDAQYYECLYEQGALACLKAAGYAYRSCSALKPLPQILACNPTDKQLADYEAVDPQYFFPNDGVRAAQVTQCLATLNTTIVSGTQPYLAPPVSARLLPHCTPTVCDLRAGARVGVFDPCSSSNCVKSQ